jgi:hypothetical protein
MQNRSSGGIRFDRAPQFCRRGQLLHQGQASAPGGLDWLVANHCRVFVANAQ